MNRCMAISHLTEVATQAAKEAGELLARGLGTNFAMTTKEGRQNLVTEYDLASQKLIIETIKKTFPDHHFLAEEEDVHAHPSDQILWIIDPLDGTVNFAHGIPFFAVSIAAFMEKEIVCGVVYNPMIDELFVAEKGRGSTLNGNQLQVTKIDQFDKALLATGFPYNAFENPIHCIDRFGKMVAMGNAIRRIGVAALDLAYVAAGRFDGFWECSLHPWDMAAGKLLVEEAGGKVSHYDGSPHPIFAHVPILATNGYLHEQMVEILKGDLK